jgi:translocation and assembly module TamB
VTALAAARALVFAALTAAMTVTSVLLHLNVPVVHRVTMARVNQLVFAPIFSGTMEIVRLGHVDPRGGVSGVSVRVRDPSGQPVLSVDGLESRIALLTLCRSLLSRKGPIRIELSGVSLPQVDLRLDMDDRGMALAEAFLPKPHPSESGPPGKGVRLDIPYVHIGHAWIHGVIPKAPYIDADVADVDAAFSLEPTGLSADLRRAVVVGRGTAAGRDVAGTAAGHFALALDESLAMGGHVRWDGAVGQLREVASVGLEGGRFDASVDVPDASPDAVRSFWPSSTIRSPGVAHVEAHGPLGEVDLVAHASMDKAVVDVTGQLGWGATKRAKVHVAVDGVDVTQFGPSLPVSSLGVRGDVALSLDPTGRLEGEATLEVSKGHVGPHLVPHTTLDTHGFRVSRGAFGGEATVVIDEPGAPTTLTLHAVPRGDSSSVDFAIASRDVRIGALRRLGADATGNVRVLGKGNVDLEHLLVDVSVDTHGDRLRQGAFRVGGVAVEGRVRGGLANPDVDLALHARELDLGPRKLSDLDVTVRGKALWPHVTVHERGPDLPDVDGEADVELLEGPTIRRADLRFVRGGELARARVDRVQLGGGRVSVDALVIEGLGQPVMATFRVEGTSARARVHAPAIDLSRLARLARLEGTIHRGTLSVDVDGASEGWTADGSAHLTLQHASIVGIDELSAHLDGRMHGRRFVGTAGVQAGGVADVEVSAKDLDLGGVRPSAATFRRASGDVTLTGHADLPKLATELHIDLPVEALGGSVEVKGRFQRDSVSDFTPLVEISATTTGLDLRGRPTGPQPPPAGQPPPWRLTGLDVDTVVRVNGDTGFLALSATVHDAKGPLVEVAAESPAVPYKVLYESPSQAVAALPRCAFKAKVSLPRRPMDAWPPILGRPPVDGELSADVDLEGPLITPRVAVVAELRSVGVVSARLTSPVDLALSGSYDGAAAHVELRGRAASHDVLVADATVSAAVADLIAHPREAAWSASGNVRVDGFPLITIGALDDRQIRGLATGDLHVENLHKDAKADATLSIEHLKVGDTAYSKATADFHADGTQAAADVRLEEEAGFLAAKASVAAKWGASLTPLPDPGAMLAVELQAKHFRAGVARPFMQGAVDELDGLVDADVHVTVDPRSASVHLTGSADLREGLIEVSDVGGEFHDITAHATAAPDGTLTVDHVTAFGVTGAILASATAQLDGLRLKAANATVEIPKARALPLTVGGAQLGALDGKFDVTETMSLDRKTLEVSVNVPTLHMQAPEEGSQDVQGLGPMSGITVGVRKTPGGPFIEGSGDAEEPAAPPRPEDAVALHVVTHLGDDVVVRRGTDVQVQLTGGPTITLTDKARVSGQIQLKRGTLNLYGKKFEIEHGTVSFVGADPGNPQVSVTAGWTASDGTQVQAEFLGPLKSGKVTLRSTPALSQNEIVQLLLFGSVDETQPASAQGGGIAEGVAGNLAAQPLNRALDQFGLSAVSAKVDTTTVNAKPEVVVQVAKDISLQLAHILYIGPPPPGTSPDTTLLTIDWRFLRKWALDATVGNAGSTIVDLVWKYRY